MRRLLAFTIGLLLAACSRQEPPVRNTLAIVQTQDLNSLNPVFVSGFGGQEVAALLYSYLVKLDAAGEVVPDAAVRVPTLENGGISSDGLTITYRLRAGVRFSDGSLLRASDVAATIRAIGRPDSPAPSRVGYDDVASVSAPDPATVRVVLRRPYAPIVLDLCGPGSGVPILPHGSLASQTVGSGPYKVRSWTRSDRLELDANASYFDGAPHIKHLIIRFVPSSSTALEMLRTREADAFVNADDTQYRELTRLPGIRTEQAPTYGVGALIFNTQTPQLREARVRRALAQAFDTRAVVGKTLQGSKRANAPGRGLFQWAYDESAFAMPPFDPKAARAILAPMHLDLSLIVRADKPTAVAFATEVQAAEAAIGVTVAIKRWPVIALVAPNGPLYGGHYDLALFPFIGGPDPDVTDQFACDRIPPHGFNKPRFCDPSLDEIMESAASTYDRGLRVERYRAIQRTLASELPLDALYQLVIIDAFPARLRGEATAPTGPFWNVAAWQL